MEINPLLNLSVSQLKKAAQLKEQIDALNGELAQILGGGGSSQSGTEVRNGRTGGRRKMSAAGRAKIAAAARARWAKIKSSGGAANLGGSQTKKRTMSAVARKKIAAAQKARWAKVRAANLS